MKRGWAQRAEYAGVRLASALLGALPRRAAMALAWGAGGAYYWLNRRLRGRTRRRIRDALGKEVAEQEVCRIGRIAFRNLVFMAVEGMRLPRMGMGEAAGAVEFDGLEEIRTELGKGRGLIVALPHMGNWEMAGMALQARGIGVVTLARRQRNPWTNAWIGRIRARTGMEAIDTRSRAIAGVGAKLNPGGKVLAILPDVRAKNGGAAVRFLGAETKLPAGLAKYARETGAAIATAEGERKGWTRHAWRLTGRIEADLGLDAAADGRRIMQCVADRFEQSVRAHPESYFWFNPRWVLGAEAKK